MDRSFPDYALLHPDDADKKWPGLLPAIFILVTTRLSAAAQCRAGAAAARPVRH
jgi:hypothetical protein